MGSKLVKPGLVVALKMKTKDLGRKDVHFEDVRKLLIY